ncbi:MAG: hypothetical protein Harvfovirus67_2 [Harvfovirus sp.]|uniref:Ankyrin repeat protein n=1 Tax=Harvfovirus sp. TaxID=2487768 RepID=A0A3G5A3Y8_9VIRU|nr:MAG: hypothetical protein Harvfovirus67_2 [Harvfovirus sp.]
MSEPNEFLSLCRNGKLLDAQLHFEKVLPSDQTILDSLHRAFLLSCENGHLTLSIWLDDIGNTYHVSFLYIEPFLASCINGHLTTAKWIVSLGQFYLPLISQEIFISCCECSQLEIAQWLYAVTPINIHFDTDRAFTKSCSLGNLDIAIWLYSFGDIDHTILTDTAYKSSCENYNFHIARWLLTLESVYIDAKLINYFGDSYDEDTIALLYHQGYNISATDLILKKKFKSYRRKKIRQYLIIIRFLGILNNIFHQIRDRYISRKRVNYEDFSKNIDLLMN